MTHFPLRVVGSPTSPIVRVEGCESGICGFVESLRLPEEIDQTTLLDIKNKDRSLRDRPIIGLNLFSRFDSITPGKSEYLKGRVYHPDHGRSYKANLRLLESGQLEIEGCVFAFCQQEAWVRLPPCTPEGAHRPHKSFLAEKRRLC